MLGMTAMPLVALAQDKPAADAPAAPAAKAEEKKAAPAPAKEEKKEEKKKHYHLEAKLLI